MDKLAKLAIFAWAMSISSVAWAASIVPNEVMMPGTQPGEVSNLEAATKCDNCHGGYSTAVEPAFNWRGSMMSHAARDPVFDADLDRHEDAYSNADTQPDTESVGHTNADHYSHGDANGYTDENAHHYPHFHPDTDRHALGATLHLPGRRRQEQLRQLRRLRSRPVQLWCTCGSCDRYG